MITVIPAIDIIDGKCVRLTKGDYGTKKVYNQDPVDVAMSFQDAGCRRLHLVDLDGAKSSHIVNYHVVERIASKTGLVIDLGGGIKSDDDVRIAFDSGASLITGGSIAVKSPDIFLSWLRTYGADRIILGADARDGYISTSGWLHDSDEEIVPFVKRYVADGVRNVISTDINVDGTFKGPSIELYKRMIEEIEGLYLIASGGVGSMADIRNLEAAGIPAVIVGKAIYEGFVSLRDLELFNTENH